MIRTQTIHTSLIATFYFLTLSFSASIHADGKDMSFFVTSVGSGNGGNLDGLKGADAHCQNLANAVNTSKKKWHAYLSTSTENARDRIGKGPWHNTKGIMIAKDVNDLHSDNNTISKENALNEKGIVINGRGDKPNEHDILTGSLKDGTTSNANCNNWTSNAKGSASLGHHDKKGPAGRISWNSSHESLGCSIEDLKKTGGNGYFYCFAID